MLLTVLAFFQGSPPVDGELVIPGLIVTLLAAASPFIINFFRDRFQSEKIRFIISLVISGAFGAGVGFYYGLDAMGLAAFVNGSFLVSQTFYRMWFKKIFKQDEAKKASA